MSMPSNFYTKCADNLTSMTTNVNLSLAALTRELSHKFLACLRGVSQAPLEPLVERALAEIGEVVCPNKEATTKRITKVIAASHPQMGGIWRVRLERAPKRLCAAAASMVEGAKGLQGWGNATFLPGTPVQLWIETTLTMEPILAQIAEARRSHRPTRVKSTRLPANQEVSNEKLAAALRKHPKNRSAAARKVGLAPQTVDARIEAAKDDPTHALNEFWYPPRRFVPNDELARVIAEVGGVDSYEQIREIARRLGWKSPSKVMDRIWTAGPEDSDLGKFWRPKRRAQRPPTATEIQTAGIVATAPTLAAASGTLSIAPSTMSRRVRTAETPDLRAHKRAPDAPHPGLRVEEQELLEALVQANWNRSAAARILKGRISPNGIDKRLAAAKEGSALKEAHQAWLATKVY